MAHIKGVDSFELVAFSHEQKNKILMQQLFTEFVHWCGHPGAGKNDQVTFNYLFNSQKSLSGGKMNKNLSKYTKNRQKYGKYDEITQTFLEIYQKTCKNK